MSATLFGRLCKPKPTAGRHGRGAQRPVPLDGQQVGKLTGKQPKLTPRRQAELVRMHATGDYTIADLTEVFAIGPRHHLHTPQPRNHQTQPRAGLQATTDIYAEDS